MYSYLKKGVCTATQKLITIQFTFLFMNKILEQVNSIQQNSSYSFIQNSYKYISLI